MQNKCSEHLRPARQACAMAQPKANAVDTVVADDASITADAKHNYATATTSSTFTDSKAATISPQGERPRGWFHWHEPGTSKEEKKLIFKLDWFLLSFGCLLFFVKQVSAPPTGYISNTIANSNSWMATTSPMPTFQACKKSSALDPATNYHG